MEDNSGGQWGLYKFLPPCVVLTHMRTSAHRFSSRRRSASVRGGHGHMQCREIGGDVLRGGLKVEDMPAHHHDCTIDRGWYGPLTNANAGAPDCVRESVEGRRDVL
jgi:hypothetical protein